MDGHGSSRTAALVMGAGLAAFLLVYLCYRPWDLHGGAMIGAPFGRDFVNFWLGGRLALQGSLPTLADLPAYNDLVARSFAHTRGDSFIFSYPPHILLLLAPLACLPYHLALAVWTAGNLAALAIAARVVAHGERGGGRLAGVATCLSPAALVMVLYGHFGGLLALALATIVGDGKRRPVVAGLCLAGLTVKPQLALVVGLVLLGAGRWRCVCASIPATMLLLGASVAAFGLDPWRGFLDVTLPEQARMLADFEVGMLGTTISPYLGARALGLSGGGAAAVQLLVGGAALALAVRALRREGTRRQAVLATALAAVVALPYSNAYDLALAAPALTPMVLREDNGNWAAFARLATWLAPPLAWHLMSLGIPFLAVATAAALAASAAPSGAHPMQARLAA